MTEPTARPKLRHLAIVARDPEKLAEFYSSVFAMELFHRDPDGSCFLSDGYLCRVYTDANRPIFMPLWNYAMNQGGPDPDYVYSTTEVDPAGTYRISGYRGTSRFVEITQQGFDMMNMGQLEQGSPVPGSRSGKMTR